MNDFTLKNLFDTILQLLIALMCNTVFSYIILHTTIVSLFGSSDSGILLVTFITLATGAVILALSVILLRRDAAKIDTPG